MESKSVEFTDEDPEASTALSAIELLAETKISDSARFRVRRSLRLLFTAGGLTAGAAFLVPGAMSNGTFMLATGTLFAASLGVGWFVFRLLDRPQGNERLLRVAPQRPSQLSSLADPSSADAPQQL